MARLTSSWPLFFFAGLLILALVLHIVQKASPDHQPIDDAPKQEQILLNEATCHASGGTWNDCGSLCRTNPSMPCAQVCVQQCTCVSHDQCPFGYQCGEFFDGEGVCTVGSSSSL